MKHNLEKKFSSFDIILVLILIAVMAINILVSGSLPAPGMRKASKDAVTATGHAQGKEGDVVVEVVADAGNIYAVNILEQNETPGIGSMAVEQLPAVIVGENSLAVDAVATATVTSNAIIKAASEALTSAGFDPATFGYIEEMPAEEKEMAAPVMGTDGKVTASGKGTGIDGDIVIEVVADENTIYEVKVLEQNETPGIGSVAVEKLPGAIVEANSIEVDGITGATVSSNAIKTAVSEALKTAGYNPENYGKTATPGKITVSSTANGKNGPVVVEVVADANTIYEVRIIKHNETPGVGSVAAERLPNEIVKANSVSVDGVTGATVTSDAIKAAVSAALKDIGFSK